MDSLQRLCAAAVLTLAFTLPALAGDISTGIGYTPPPPPPPAAQGDMDCPRASVGTVGGEAAAADPLAAITLSLLQSVLALF